MEPEALKPNLRSDCDAVIRKNLEPLRDVFAKAAVGDFSSTIEIPEEENEFTGLYAGIAIVFDVINKQLEQLRKEAAHEEQLNEAKSEFIALISHQLRTPLTAMKWALDQLSLDAASLNPSMKKAIDSIAAAAEDMNGMVESVLEISRIKIGSIAVQPKDTDAVAAIKGVLESIQGIAEANAITLKENLPETFMTSLDLSIFRNILSNIVSNATKYTPKGGVVEISLKQSGEHFVIEIADNGYGIPESEQEHIFTRLYRGSAAKKGADGSGLGLYVVKMLIERAGGAIAFTSKEGAGTTFFVSFPLAGMLTVAGDISV